MSPFNFSLIQHLSIDVIVAFFTRQTLSHLSINSISPLDPRGPDLASTRMAHSQTLCQILLEDGSKNCMMTHNPFTSPSDPRPGKGVIFIVDDEFAFCDVVCEILEAIGYDPHFALNAIEALQMLPQVKPDLILSDVMMPEMDGLSFVRHLRDQSIWEAIPIVIVSAKATADDRRSALESGATDFLAKPFSSYDLEELIERNLHSDGH